MTEYQQIIAALVGILAIFPISVVAIKKNLHQRLSSLSGGQVKTFEDLVAVALREDLTRAKPIGVSGVTKSAAAELWAEMRRGGFIGAAMGKAGENAEIQVFHAGSGSDEETAAALGGMACRVLVLYKTGAPYRGPMPPGASITFANSLITLEARAWEALQYLDRRQA